MKTKAYKLAVELGLQEQALLDWLRAHGYPNARRTDTIRADVVQAARRSLSRGAPTSRRGPKKRSGLTAPQGEAPAGESSTDSLRVSFAELLAQHLPGDAGQGHAELPETRGDAPTLPTLEAISLPVEVEAESPALRVARAEAARDESRRETEEWRVRHQRTRSNLEEAQGRIEVQGQRLAALEGLPADRERLLNERAALRQQLAQVESERSTLEQTATELQAELREVRASLGALESRSEQERELEGELEAARHRELAWRARALELERAALLGESLPAALARLGVKGTAEQSRLLVAVLAHREGAAELMRSIRNIDADALGRLVEQRVCRVCAHPVCNQVADLDGRFALRVNTDRDCEVCQGSEDRRWFRRMVRESTRAGIRRLLVIGGPGETQERLRGLSQGQPVDLRLVGADEAVQARRVRGRVEGCDLLVIWSTGVVDVAVSAPYEEAARAEGRPVAIVVGAHSSVSALARAVCNRLARSLMLNST